MNLLIDLLKWITFSDYEEAKSAATKRIVMKQSRGNIASQNGWFMTSGRLNAFSKKADDAAERLRKQLTQVS